MPPLLILAVMFFDQDQKNDLQNGEGDWTQRELCNLNKTETEKRFIIHKHKILHNK